jgi:hypothetical protein
MVEKIPPIPTENPAHRVGQALILRDIGGEIDGVGQDTRLRRLPFLIDPEQRVSEHGSRVIHEGRWKHQRNGPSVKLFDPSFEALARHGRKPAGIKTETIVKPCIPRHKGTLSRLLRSTDQLRQKELSQGGVELSLRIGLAFWRKKETRLVLFARIAAEQIRAIVEQQMPLTRISQMRVVSALKQVRKIGRRWLLRLDRDCPDTGGQQDK